MAWKVPLETLIWEGVTNPKCQRLKNPPSASAFFKPGDELWDVMAAVEWEAEEAADLDPFAPPVTEDQPGPGLEWLVWNASSGKLVGHGSWAQLDIVEQQLDLPGQPHLIRTTFEVHRDRAEPSTVSLLSQSGEEFSSKSRGLHLSATAHLSADRMLVDIALAASWQRDTDWTDGIEIGATVPVERTVSLATWQDEQGSWEVRVSCEAITTEGTLITQLREFETPRGIERIDDGSVRHPTVSRRSLANGLVTGSFHVPPDFLFRISGDRRGVFPDLAQGKDARIFPGPRWIDVREPLRANGLQLSTPGSLAGFHPDDHIITVVSTSTDVDLLEVIVSPGCICRPLAIEHTLQSPGIMARLLCRSGERVGIVRSRRGTSGKLLEIATNIGAGERLMDVRYLIDFESGIHLDSATILTTGEPQEIAVFESVGKRSAVTLTGTIRVMDH